MTRLRAWVAAGVLGLAGCGGTERTTNQRSEMEIDGLAAQPGTERTSPSGSFELTVEELGDNPPDWQVLVRAQDGSEVFRSEELFSVRHSTHVLWDDVVDRVWVYSGDIGIYTYDVDADGRWLSSTWTELSRPEPPPALKAARPESSDETISPSNHQHPPSVRRRPRPGPVVGGMFGGR